tara:strand:- start:7699 stop:7899 length:201 start_codon:yes stop_codon:yes gene_type:complete
MIPTKKQQELVLRALLKTKKIENGNAFVGDFEAARIIKELVIELKACQLEIGLLTEKISELKEDDN